MRHQNPAVGFDGSIVHHVKDILDRILNRCRTCEMRGIFDKLLKHGTYFGFLFWCNFKEEKGRKSA
jgi:hypothetical protein